VKVDLYKLRPVCKNDSELVREWRNRLEVRSFMFSHSEISKSDHYTWFRSMLLDDTRQWHVLNIKGQECAIIYFTDIVLNSSCSWGFYSGMNAPLGVGLVIEVAALTHAFDSLGVNRLHCEVLSGNQQVINLHKKTGFVQEGRLRQAHLSLRGLEDVIIFGMLKEEWFQIRAELEKAAFSLLSRL
jgi:UDP-4-amino-4,6-dideoxy-N-acetyl-beta-L-altrosamine N-acetyltransferase